MDSIKDKVLTLYKSKMTASDIAFILEISVAAVDNYIKSLEEENDFQFCENCGKRMVSIKGKKQKRFCCDKCRNEWWNSHQDKVNKKAYYVHTCACCRRKFVSYSNKNAKYCSHKCYIKHRYNKEIKHYGKRHG